MSAYRVPPAEPPRVPGVVLVVLGGFAGWAWALFVTAVFPS